MSTEMLAASQFIYESLTESEAIRNLIGTRIYEEVAPVEVDLPAIIFSLSSSEDVILEANARAMTRLVYVVRAVGRGGGYLDSGVEVLADLVDLALHNSQGGSVVMCRRERPVTRSYTDDGVVYYERGGYYEVIVYKR